VETPLMGVPAFRAAVDRDAACAIEQLFGLMLSSEVALVAPGAQPLCPWPGEGVHARIDLKAEGAPVVAVAFRADRHSATVIAAQLLGAPPEDVVDDDIASTAAEFANIIVGRLRNRLVEAGVPMAMSLPTSWTGSTAAGFPVDDASTLTFNSTHPEASFGLLLSVQYAHAA
jgi:hypothetical protein